LLVEHYFDRPVVATPALLGPAPHVERRRVEVGHDVVLHYRLCQLLAELFDLALLLFRLLERLLICVCEGITADSVPEVELSEARRLDRDSFFQTQNLAPREEAIARPLLQALLREQVVLDGACELALLPVAVALATV